MSKTPNTERKARKPRVTKATLAAKAAELEATEDGEDEEAPLPRSVVKGTYKAKYRDRGETVRKPKGFSKKAAKRSTCDWLAFEIGTRTLDEKAKLQLEPFVAILEANGVKHDHWKREGRGWQGRLRMTGRLALQRVVAENGVLALPDGTEVKAPASWVAQHQH